MIKCVNILCPYYDIDMIDGCATWSGKDIQICKDFISQKKDDRPRENKKKQNEIEVWCPYCQEKCEVLEVMYSAIVETPLELSYNYNDETVAIYNKDDAKIDGEVDHYEYSCCGEAVKDKDGVVSPDKLAFGVTINDEEELVKYLAWQDQKRKEREVEEHLTRKILDSLRNRGLIDEVNVTTDVEVELITKAYQLGKEEAERGEGI